MKGRKKRLSSGEAAILGELNDDAPASQCFMARPSDKELFVPDRKARKINVNQWVERIFSGIGESTKEMIVMNINSMNVDGTKRRVEQRELERVMLRALINT